jgi:hypothetical protein
MGRFAAAGYGNCAAEALAPTIAPVATRDPSPTGVRKRRPKGGFVSASHGAASGSIHPPPARQTSWPGDRVLWMDRIPGPPELHRVVTIGCAMIQRLVIV